MIDLKVMMFSKKKNIFCDYAEAILKSYFNENEYLSIRGNVGDQFNEELYYYKPNFIISFISPWIIPGKLLNLAKNSGGGSC